MSIALLTRNQIEKYLEWHSSTKKI